MFSKTVRYFQSVIPFLTNTFVVINTILSDNLLYGSTHLVRAFKKQIRDIWDSKDMRFQEGTEILVSFMTDQIRQQSLIRRYNH